MQKEKALRKTVTWPPTFHSFSPLHDAHNVLWDALLPLEPFRALTLEDMSRAEPGLVAWEMATDSISILPYDSGGNSRPNTNLLLVESMLRFCDYGSALPDIPGTNQTELLRQRFVKLKGHIETALLAEARSDERFDRRDRSDAQCDLDLVRDWANEIQAELLKPGQQTNHWTTDSLPWILGYLTTWEDIEFSVLRESGITIAVRDIIYAPTIPIVSYMRPIRSWAASLLDRWISRPEAQVLPLYEKAGLGLDVLPETSQSSNESHSVPEILYHTGEIAQDFQELKDALIASTDHDRIFSALDKIETWEAEPLSAQSFQKTLFGLTMAHRHPAKEVTDRLYGSRKFSIPTHIQRQVTGFSYYTPAEETTFQLTFRDKNSLPNTYRSMRLPREEPDERIWADVTVETTSTSPIDVLFGQFIAMSNSRHQHPLAPLSGFSFASASSFVGKTNEEVAKIRNSTWKVRPGRFVQGQVKDLLVTESKVVYYSRSNFSRDSVSDLTLKPPQQRTLPPSCVAPQHWIRPAMPPGGEAVWECLPSLAFVGNGHDLYPGATSPPAITSHIYVPRAFDRERLGIYPHAAYQREVTKDATPVKLEPPITAAQAAALLGRAIQFEVPVVPLPPLPPNARPKKRRREPPPPIYWGVVWGVDAAALELRIFTGGQYQEASATLKVGQPCAVPSNPIDMTRPFTPKWVGLLSLVDGAPEETVPAPAPEAGPTVDRLLSILAVAARSPQFEVGIDGDCVVIAGEISLHGIDSPSVEKIDGCKSGIWQGAREPAGTDQFSMWVRWVRDGTIDLTQPVERFVVTPEGDGDAAALQWTPLTTVTADGGKMALLARGLTSPESIFALTGNDDGDVAGFVECIVLYGAEEDSFHIPGGVSSYTGGDGSFDVLTASDSDGKVVGIKITVSQ